MSILWTLLGARFARRRLAARAVAPVLRDFYRAAYPPATTAINGATYCALDLETTGLDPMRDRIVSFGLVIMHGLRIDLGTGRHELVVPEDALPAASVVVHGITDDRAADGRTLEQAVEAMLEALTGHVLVAHHCAMELGFLDQSCRRLYGLPFRCPTIDTEVLGRRWYETRNQGIRPGALRLHALREKFGLPRYKAHDALMDAIGTAELFAAFVAQSHGESTAIRRYLCRH